MKDHNFKFWVGSEGPRSAEIACVAEKPATEEVIQDRPLIGSSGDYARSHFVHAGLNPGTREYIYDRRKAYWTQSENVYLTNAVQNFNDPKANPTLEDVWREQPRLLRELAAMPNLKMIVAMGNYALASLGNFAYNKLDKSKLTGISKWRGSIIPSIIPSRLCDDTIKMLPTFHPSFYMQDNWKYKDIVNYDIARAALDRSFPERRYRERVFNIAPDSFAECLSWFHEINNDLDAGKYDWSAKSGKVFRFLGSDIEAVRAGPCYDKKGKPASRYICCIAFALRPEEAYCIPIMWNDRRAYWTSEQEATIWRLIQQLFDRTDCIFVGQNWLGLDAPVLRKHGIVFHAERLMDTMTMHNQLAADLDHDQGFLTSIYTSPIEPYYKDESGDWDIMIKTPEPTFWVYNCKDACVMIENLYGIINDLIEAGRVAA